MLTITTNDVTRVKELGCYRTLEAAYHELSFVLCTLHHLVECFAETDVDVRTQCTPE